MKSIPKVSVKNVLALCFGLLVLGTAYEAGMMAHRNALSPAAQLGEARKLLAHGDGKVAAAIFEQLAASGNAEADYWLADIYSHGVGVPADEATAIGYLKTAANKGNGPAELQLGEIYARGDQTAQDFEQARTWLSKAAMQGDAEAARDLGRIYDKGLGVTRDPITAYAWYEIAVLHGDQRAEPKRDRVVAALDPAQLGKAETKARTLNAQIGHSA